jgi:hypothetical protein
VGAKARKKQKEEAMRPKIKNLKPTVSKTANHTYTSIPLGNLVSVDGGGSYKLGAQGGVFFSWRDRAGIHEMVDQVMDKLDEQAALEAVGRRRCVP